MKRGNYKSRKARKHDVNRRGNRQIAKGTGSNFRTPDNALQHAIAAIARRLGMSHKRGAKHG